ncbi:hypothetical protein AN958_11033 [Leucoagaricus sp. SymC.cos]|nr:hypothetical protein AN958_11033 [Leucoagaricus sp. SymC.cos]
MSDNVHTHTHTHTPIHAHHHHENAHGHHGSVAQANREFFDDLDDGFDKIPFVKERAARVVKAIVKAYPNLDKEKTTAMDFACGNGHVSIAMLPHVKSILGVDISERMAARYNEKLEDSENASAVAIELKGEDNELSGARFDIIFCSSAYHHFESIDEITRILVSFLKPGGALLIADMVNKEEGYAIPQDAQEAVPHKHGFSKGDIRKAFEAGGLTMKVFEDIPSSEDHADLDLFLAIGEKPSI